MCDIFSARPAFSTAATESPPPMMVVQPVPVSSASVSAIANVPLEKASNSKTPCGGRACAPSALCWRGLPRAGARLPMGVP
eukprot:408195-Prymnesium_polylepis.1